MRKSLLCPVLAAALGAVAAALRMWHRSSAYDEAGLPVPGSFAAIILAFFLVLYSLGCLLFVLRQPKVLTDQSAAAPRGVPPAALLSLSGGLLVVGGVLNLKRFADGYLAVAQTLYASADAHSSAIRAFLLSHLLPLLLVIASVPAAAALLYQAKRCKTGEEGPFNAFAALMPTFFCWLWLIETYRQHTSNPIIWDYVLLLFAVVALLLSGYYRAGFIFGAGKTRLTILTSLLALFFAVSALPDSGDIPTALTLIALALHTLVELNALLTCLTYRPRRLAADSSDQSIQQEDAPHES